MQGIYFIAVLALFSLISSVNGHARIKHPRPLAAPVDSPAGNYYNNPLRPDGSDFPCKGLHKKADVDKRPTETWQAGQQTRFEILGHGPSGGEGALAAHSGGSCQASLSFNNGETWKVLHTFTGGCPRGARLGSNMAGNNQTFPFIVPINTKAGNALFSWSWIAVTGNRNEYYQNCASVLITGSGNSTLDDLPDMFVGDMTLASQVRAGECRSSAGYAIEYPFPGEANTIVQVSSIQFKKPTGGQCFTRAIVNSSTTRSSSVSTTTRTSSTSTTTRTTTRATSKLSTTSRMSSSSSTSTPPRRLTTLRVSTTAATTTASVSTVLPPAGGLPSQCSTYMLITDKTRRSSHAGHIVCDTAVFKKVPTWVRFSGGAGTRLAREPAEPFRCNTQGAGWYSGPYPTTEGATLSGTVCYSWPRNSCQWSNEISITNCKDYYVFALPAPPACFLRYCTS